MLVICTGLLKTERLLNVSTHVLYTQTVKAPVATGARSDGSVQCRKMQSVSVSVPGYGRRRKGSSAYYVYEVKVSVQTTLESCGR